jgi:biotin transport system substrate-specific component
MLSEASEVLGQKTQPAIGSETRGRELAKQVVIVVAASLFIALCARVAVPLPFTPVPLTLQNFAVITVGLLLGSRRGFAALALYLAEGAIGLPVFSSAILGTGLAHLFGPTGGFLMAYPAVAFLAGWIYERSSRGFVWAVVASTAAELLLFAGGLSWLALLTHSVALAIKFGLYWFVFAEVIKIFMAAGVAQKFHHLNSSAN